MNCRICDGKCENESPAFAGLCRACGQKREAYAAAAVPSVLSYLLTNKDSSVNPNDRRAAMIDTMFNFAEAMVKRDRRPV
jgi:hypothetical protein